MWQRGPKQAAVVENVRTIADDDARLGGGKRAGLHAVRPATS
jgi:hypothetical protein